MARLNINRKQQAGRSKMQPESARVGHAALLARNLYHPELASIAAMVADFDGLSLKQNLRQNVPDEHLQAWAERAGLSLRRVALAANWWQHAEQAILVCLSSEAQHLSTFADASGVSASEHAAKPYQLLALLPDQQGQYMVHGLPDRNGYDGHDEHDSHDSQISAAVASPRPLDAALASQIRPVAWRLHASLPARVLSLFDLLGVAWQLALQDLLRLLLVTLVMVCLVWLAPQVLQSLLQAMLDGKPNWPGLASLLCGLALGVVGLRAWMQHAVLRIDKRLAVGIQAALFERLLHLPLHFFQQHASHQLGEKIVQLDRLRRQSAQLTVQILSALALLLASMLYLVVNLALYAGVLLVLPLFMLSLLMAILMRVRHTEQRRQQVQAGEAQAAQLLMQLLQNLGKLRLAGAQQAVFARWQRLLGALPQNMHGIALWQTSLLLLEIFLFGVGAWRSIVQFDLAELAGLVLALLCWHGASRRLLQCLPALLQLHAQLMDIKPILQTQPDGLSPPIGQVDASPQISGQLQVQHLAFAYPGAQQPLLRDISLQVQAGQFVAIVGASGSGKSTLLRLLMGQYPASAGEIYYDARPLKQFKLAALQPQLALVEQDTPYLAGSLFENIAANQPCSMAQAWLAAEKAGLAEEIRSMPLGMHTVLSDASAALSSGQIQRLLLARALARMLSGQASILLLDDALSALDSASQTKIYAGLAGFTCILLTQCLASLRHAAQIFVLRDGIICAQGQYAELRAANTEFAKLAAGQSLAHTISDEVSPEIATEIPPDLAPEIP